MLFEHNNICKVITLKVQSKGRNVLGTTTGWLTSLTQYLTCINPSSENNTKQAWRLWRGQGHFILLRKRVVVG